MILPLQLLFDQPAFLHSAELGVDHPPVISTYRGLKKSFSLFTKTIITEPILIQSCKLPTDKYCYLRYRVRVHICT